MNTMSIWHKSVTLPEFPPLSGDESAEVAIIGGGMAGLLTAHFLRERGIRALVLEAGRICSGQTGRTTAKITSQHDLIYASLIDRLGEDAAAQYARANEAAIADYARMIEEGRIACDFTRCDAFLYSRTEAAPLEQEAQAASRLGIAADFTRESELPFEIAGAVRFREQARFHPLKFLRAIVDGLDIRENTCVLSVEDDRIHTDRGTVKAEHIVFACHYPFVNAPGFYFARMHQERSYVLALENTWLPRHVHLGIDGEGLSLPGKYPHQPDLAASALWSTPRELLAIAKAFIEAYHGRSTFLQEASAREMAKRVEKFPWTGLGVFPQGEDIIMSQGWGENGQCMLKMNLRTCAACAVMTNRNPETDQAESGVEWLVDSIMGSATQGS